MGDLIGIKGNMPAVYTKIEISHILIHREEKIDKIGKNEMLKLNIGSLTVDAKVLAVKADLLKLELLRPACVISKSKISLSRKIKKNTGWRLIGIGMMCSGEIILNV